MTGSPIQKAPRPAPAVRADRAVARKRGAGRTAAPLSRTRADASGEAGLRSSLLIVAATLLATAGWVFSYHAIQGLPPILFVGCRFALAGLVLAAVVRARGGTFGRTVRPAAAVGLVAGVSMGAWIQGLATTDNFGVGGFLTSLGILAAPVAGRIAFGWTIPPATRLASLVAAAGMALLFLDGGARLTGADGWFIAASIGFAIQFALNSRLTATIPVLPLTAVQLIVCGLVNLALSAAIEVWPTAMPDAATWGWFLASVLIATSLRFAVQITGQSGAPVARTALLMCVEPVWTAIVGVFLIGMPMTPTELAGCGLIFLALLVNARRRKPGVSAGSAPAPRGSAAR